VRFHARRQAQAAGQFLGDDLLRVVAEHDVDFVRCGIKIIEQALRAAVLAGHEITAVVALAGDVPPELGELPSETPFPRRALLARGEGDDWYSEAKLESDAHLLAARGVEVLRCSFAGGHEWSDPFRAAAGEFLGSFRRGERPSPNCDMIVE
jgi:hypothetical protein